MIGIYSYLYCHPGGGGWIKITTIYVEAEEEIDNEKRIKKRKRHATAHTTYIFGTHKVPCILISLKIGNQHECSK